MRDRAVIVRREHQWIAAVRQIIHEQRAEAGYVTSQGLRQHVDLRVRDRVEVLLA
jgi:hypothetical protein